MLPTELPNFSPHCAVLRGKEEEDRLEKSISKQLSSRIYCKHSIPLLCTEVISMTKVSPSGVVGWCDGAG